MPETEYNRLENDGGSEGSSSTSARGSASRDTSLDLKRKEARIETYEIAGEEGRAWSWDWKRLNWRRVIPAMRRLRGTSVSRPIFRNEDAFADFTARGNIFSAIVVAFLLLTIFNLGFHKSSPPLEIELAPPNPEYNRIAKVSMLFGEPSVAYERALKSHERHAARWGYPFYVLKRDEGCGFWTKLVYMMSILGLELQKDPDERVEWLMWGDADSVILNPNIPISLFLPPPDLPHIHFVGTRDWNGLNNGVFFLRVHPWSVSMLTSAMSYPLCHQEINLGANVEQEGMRLTFARPSGGQGDLGWRSGVVYMPKIWFNTYEMAMGDGDVFRESHPDLVVDYPGLKLRHYYEGHRGDMLVHCPGVGHDVRKTLMNDWMDLVESEYTLQYGSLNATSELNETEYRDRTAQWEHKVNATSSHIWSLPLQETNYTNITTAFWNRYRTAMDVVVEATSGTANINIAEAALGLRVSLSEEADNIETIERKIEQIQNMMHADKK